MEHLIAQYLKKHKHCSLPEIGTLELLQTPAVLNGEGNGIEGPKETVIFTHRNSLSGPLVDYIAYMSDTNTDVASQDLHEYCQSLKNLSAQEQMPFDHYGIFYVNEQGKLEFRPYQTPAAFFPSIVIERLQKQTESDSESDMEYESAEEDTLQSDLDSEVKPRKSKWWIWAIILMALAIGLIAFYIIQYSNNSMFGNNAPVHPATPSPTYKSIP